MQPILLLLLAVTLQLGCGDDGEHATKVAVADTEVSRTERAGTEPSGTGKPNPRDPSAEQTGLITASLPAKPGDFGPTRVRVEGELSGEELVDDDKDCEPCHADVVRQWRSSSHAGASLEDPTYLATFERFRKATGAVATRFCAGCHMPALTIDGAVEKPIRPDDVRAHSGLTCKSCHRISEVSLHGNGGYTLTGGQVPDPNPKVPGSLEEHKAGFALDPLRKVSLCGACHRGFLHPDLGVNQFMAGGDVITPHLASGYAGNRLARIDEPVDKLDCIGCHMRKEKVRDGDLAARNGEVSSHRFLGANTWMAAMAGDGVQLELLTEQLRGIVSIDVAAATLEDGTRVFPAEAAPVLAGQRLLLDVVLRNLEVGHLFPGAALDVQDTWIEVKVTDSSGTLIAEAGGKHARSGSDPTAHVLAAFTTDREGKRLQQREFQLFDTVVENMAIGPRDAAVVRYALDVPAGLTAARHPLTVTALLRHRRNGLELQKLACETARSARGRAFARATRALGRKVMDPCPSQPIVDIAETKVAVGIGARVQAGAAPHWRRSFDLGLALIHQVQERLDEARESFENALELLAKDGTPEERAMVQASLARVAARQGRIDEALSWLDMAEAGDPGHPALLAIRGEALALVWRWQESIAPLRKAAQSAPQDVRAWTRLAMALGSAGQDEDALAAAQTGLALWPEKPELLRVQALALKSLGHADAARAMESYMLHRGHDNPSAVRMACENRDENCARERIPAHTHELRPVTQ
ncbi:MAG: tetratricopeptide repeat protein [Myxococcales bacterium]|nr:tetratricopeptide repeat protein [Myxococcales bacterium]